MAEIVHELTMDCVCGPNVEWFDPDSGEAYESPLVLHHSLDGREHREPDHDRDACGCAERGF